MKPNYKRMLKGLKVEESSVKPWIVYILECDDGTYYTGITNNLDRRFEQHNHGNGARYTSTRRPVKLLHTEKCGNRSEALIRECAVKSLTREQKQKLIGGQNEIRIDSIHLGHLLGQFGQLCRGKQNDNNSQWSQVSG